VERRHFIPAVIAAALVGGAGLWYTAAAPEPPPPTLIASVSGISAGTLTVHVTGLVANPGLVSIPEGSRVADALVAAGGVVPGADLGALNLAAPVSDGQHLNVPDASGGGMAETDGSRVRINTAGVDVLQSLPGVGPVLAERIAAHRDEYGPFAVVEDLLDVTGIGEAKLAAMRDSVVVP